MNWFGVCFPAAVLAFAATAPAQKDGAVSIDVAVVKAHPPAVMHNNFSFAMNRFELEDQPLLKLIAFAYSLNERQILGGPAWLSEDHWDLSGKTDLTTDATLPQEQEVIRQLLADRFGLHFHSEKRELPSYALLVAKDGPRLTVAADASAQPLEWTQGHDWTRTENYRSSSMADFLVIKQLFMDRPLVDQTGLKGRYDFKLTYRYADAPAAQADAPPMFAAMKEQLGLKFEPVRAPVEVMMIDGITKPTAN